MTCPARRPSANPAPRAPRAGVDLPAGAAGGAAGAQGGAAVPAGGTAAGGLPHHLVSGRLGPGPLFWVAVYPLAFPLCGCVSARLAVAAQLVDTSLPPPPHLPARCCPRLRSAEEGVPAHLLGPMSKAWEGGVVKVVQSLENLSRETHPCNRLQGEARPCSRRGAGALGAAICLQRALTPARPFLPHNSRAAAPAAARLSLLLTTASPCPAITHKHPPRHHPCRAPGELCG